jgi:hypothetical protein
MKKIAANRNYRLAKNALTKAGHIFDKGPGRPLGRPHQHTSRDKIERQIGEETVSPNTIDSFSHKAITMGNKQNWLINVVKPNSQNWSRINGIITAGGRIENLNTFLNAVEREIQKLPLVERKQSRMSPKPFLDVIGNIAQGKVRVSWMPKARADQLLELLPAS